VKVIHQSVELLTEVNQESVLKQLELFGRNCYKSEHKITDDSYIAFIHLLLKRKHLSVLEHISISVRLITDRGMMAEITRHRLASYSIESTRYVKYDDAEFIYPFYKDGKVEENNPDYWAWDVAMRNSEISYRQLLKNNKPEIARGVLPINLKTDIVMTCNLREWLYILNLRRSAGVHPQMMELMTQVYNLFHRELPLIFHGK